MNIENDKSNGKETRESDKIKNKKC